MAAASTSQYGPSMEQLMWHPSPHMKATFSSPRSGDAILVEELRCGYASKRCDNIRTYKKGGGLHRFCEFHRRRANKNQWRVDHKRRLMRSQVKKEGSVRPYALDARIQRPSLELDGDADEFNCDVPALSASDIAMLTSILFDGEDDDINQTFYAEMEQFQHSLLAEVKLERIL